MALSTRGLLRNLACLPAVAALLLVAAPAAAADFGFLPGSEGFAVSVSGEGGLPDRQAGSHPVALTAAFNFNPGAEAPGQAGVPFSEGDLRGLRLDLPPGLIENPAAVPQCSQADFHSPRSSPFEQSLSGESCPPASQVGIATLRSSYGGGTTRTFGVFNLAPPPGAPSELGLNPYGAPILFTSSVRQAEGEYGLTLEAREIPQLTNISGLTLTLWGTPWSILHNAQRGNCLNEAEPTFGWAKCSVGRPSTHPATPFLTLPSACEGPLTFTTAATPWGPDPEARRTYSAQGLEGCGELDFAPTAEASVSDPRASSPSGYTFELDAENPGFLEPKGLAASPVRKAVVSLPGGMTINPSVGAGLGSCSPADYAAETASSAPGTGCPNSSKIGDFTVRSPLFAEPIAGSLFLAAPGENPFGSLLALYLVAKDPARGILIKVAGRVDADPAAGSLTATFDRLPQLPYSDLSIHFREGQRSPLATPAACGSYATTVALTPWRSAGTAVTASSRFAIAAGAGGGPCPSGPTPFAPAAVAGTVNAHAGSYSPFYLHLTRGDAEQEITSYSTVLPPGLTGKLAGIAYCSDAAIEAAKHETGFGETAHPSCPAASEIGHTVAGYGLGSVLAFAPGGLYLAGPFHGAPFSIVAIDSATVGPFDLGTIVIRSGIDVDPRSAQVSIDSAGSDPIPHIVDGIPIHLRDLRVYISRPDFTVNPTSCEKFPITSTLGGSGQRFSDPSDDTSTAASSPFQAFDCGSLGFRPRFSLRLRGGTRRAQFPSLRAEVRPRPGDAGIGSAVVTLPPSEFLEQGHIGTVCTRPQFAREACPPGSVYGTARAVTPLLAEPLQGKVYLRSSENKLPDLVAALRGGGNDLAIDVVGRIDSIHGGLRGSFEGLPDAPVTKFVMNLRGGRHGLLVNAENLCGHRHRAAARFVGQNRLGERLRTPVTVNCKGRKNKKKRHAGHRHHGGGRQGRGAR
ncbi:MAG TPA: hypothetical protein VFK14_11710 [Solirubrobacterales bacterium]|nr:hypothetical protein [Solirubrobacterales bacterium]